MWHKNGVRSRTKGESRRRKPLDATALRDLALRYVGRFAVSEGRLIAYLRRKIHERGWAGADEPDIAAIAARFTELGYIDDSHYAEAKRNDLGRRGYGNRRIAHALRADGIDVELVADAALSEEEEWESADLFARRKSIGPYAAALPDPRLRERQMAAFARAGHNLSIALKFVDCAPGEVPER